MRDELPCEGSLRVPFRFVNRSEVTAENEYIFHQKTH